MREPENEFERIAEASERGEGAGRSLLGSPSFTRGRVLLALSLLALSVVSEYLMESANLNFHLNAVVSALLAGGAVAALVGLPKRR